MVILQLLFVVVLELVLVCPYPFSRALVIGFGLLLLFIHAFLGLEQLLLDYCLEVLRVFVVVEQLVENGIYSVGYLFAKGK